MDKILYPNHPVRCIITGPRECGKSVFLTNLIFYTIIEYDKIYIYSPSLHQDLYQKLIKCFSKYIPIHIISNNLNEADIDIVIEEIVYNKDFEKSDTEIETYESIEELKNPQEYDDGGIIILDDLNGKKMILEFKRCSNDQDIIIYLYLISFKIITNFTKRRLEPMEISIIYSNQTIS